MIKRIVLVRSGDKYGPEYVSALTRQLNENSGARVITLTDQPDTPGKTQPLWCRFPGWWSKLELFAPWNAWVRPCLYIDLDSYVFGSLDHLKADDFRMVTDFYGTSPANSCVMWIPMEFGWAWQDFAHDPAAIMAKYKCQGDQGYLAMYCRSLWSSDDGIVSYKIDGLERKKGCIMQFHGRPKPHDIETGWAAEHWKRYSTHGATLDS